jgi:hypothetical protein
MTTVTKLGLLFAFEPIKIRLVRVVTECAHAENDRKVVIRTENTLLVVATEAEFGNGRFQ